MEHLNRQRLSPRESNLAKRQLQGHLDNREHPVNGNETC